MLFQIGQRALKPLLEALSERQGVQRDIAISVLGHLGNRNAAPPLVRLALRPPEEEATVSVPAALVRRWRRSYRRRTPVKAKPKTALRVRAIVAAGRLRDPRTVPDLAKLLSNKSVELREAAAWALSELKQRSVRTHLQKGLADPKISVEIFSCVGLGRQGRPPVGAMIKVLLSSSRRPEVRAACAFGLGLAGDRRAIAPLLETLDEERADLATKSAWALGLLGSPTAVAPLADRLWSLEGERQRAVAWALGRSAKGARGRQGGGARLVIRNGRVDWRSYLTELAPSSRHLGQLALRRLMKKYGALVARGLRVALRRHRDLVLRVLRALDTERRGLSVAAFGLGSASGPVASKTLEPLARVLREEVARLVRHRDPDVRTHALRLAAKVGFAGMVNLVSLGLADSSSQVRRAAVEAAVIAVGRRPAWRPAFVRLLAASIGKLAWHEKLERIRGLGMLKARSALPVLRRYARSSHGFLVEFAVRALGRIGDRRALPELLAALRSGAAKVRLTAVLAVARVAPRASRAALARLARTDPDARVRAAARKALK